MSTAEDKLAVTELLYRYAELIDARSTFCVVQNTESVPLQPIVVGRYFDAFARDGVGWYFTERKVDVEMVGDASTHLNVGPQQYGQ